MKAESCLQTEPHSRSSRVSAWRVCERPSRRWRDSGESESERAVVVVSGLRALGKRDGDLGREKSLVSCIGGLGLGE